MNALAAIFEPGGFVSICFGVAKGPSATSNTFGVGVSALFHLFPVTILTMIHITFDIAFFTLTVHPL